jgi:hypothetical protein
LFHDFQILIKFLGFLDNLLRVLDLEKRSRQPEVAAQVLLRDQVQVCDF